MTWAGCSWSVMPPSTATTGMSCPSDCRSEPCAGVDSFTVTSVFGRPGGAGSRGIDSPDFNLFGLSDPRQPSGASPWFLLASTLPGSLESAPVERVVVARDELANLAWAIEQRIEDDAGLPYDRYDKPSRPAAADPSAMSAYHVDTAVPEFWYPMAPRAHRSGARGGAAAVDAVGAPGRKPD